MSYYQGRKSFQSTYFVRPIPDEEQDQLFTKEVRTLFKSKRWIIQTNGFEFNNWHRVLCIVKQCPAQQLILESNARKQILKEIVHISFVNLQELNLSQNQITNIEKISNLNAPCLERIDLTRNLIVSLRSLRKVILPNLTSLRLYANKITQLGFLSELKTGYFFSNFYVQEYVDEEYICEDLSWAAKIEAKSLGFMELNCRLKIKQSKKMQMIRRRYPQVQMRKWTYFDESSDQQEEEQESEDEA